MKQLGVFLLPPGRDASPSQVTPRNLLGFPQQFAGTHLYSWVERGTVRVECLAQEHNTMSPARARTRTARSGNKHTTQHSVPGQGANPDRSIREQVHYTTQCPWPGREPGLLDPGTSALTRRPPRYFFTSFLRIRPHIQKTEVPIHKELSTTR